MLSGDVMVLARLLLLPWIVGLLAAAGPVRAQDAAGLPPAGPDAPDLVNPDCTLPDAAETVLEGQGLVLRIWRFPWDDLYAGPALPDDAAFHAYRAAVRAGGAEERYPVLDVPDGVDAAEAHVWRDEVFNNEMVYSGRAGTVEPITCLDALIFAHQNARVPQVERPTEFIASVLRRRSEGREEVAVVFGAGEELFPPNSVYGFEIVDDHMDEGWSYWYLIHNHTRQRNGALGVPIPSTSDVRLVRWLAETRGLERARVTNGFYTFDAAINGLREFRWR